MTEAEAWLLIAAHAVIICHHVLEVGQHFH